MLLITVKDEHEIVQQAELPERRGVHRELVVARIAADLNRLSSDSLLGNEMVENPVQNSLGGFVLTKQIQSVAGPAIERIQDDVPVGRVQRHPPVVATLEEDPPIARHRIEHYRTVGSDDDLQIVAESKLLQLEHEKLLHPRVQTGFDFVDQDQRAPQLRDFQGQPQDGAFSRRHVQFGIGGSGLLLREQQTLFPAGQMDDVGVSA